MSLRVGVIGVTGTHHVLPVPSRFPKELNAPSVLCRSAPFGNLHAAKHNISRLKRTRGRWLKCCFTSTETIGLFGTGAQDVHLDFRTVPEL